MAAIAATAATVVWMPYALPASSPATEALSAPTEPAVLPSIVSVGEVARPMPPSAGGSAVGNSVIGVTAIIAAGPGANPIGANAGATAGAIPPSTVPAA